MTRDLQHREIRLCLRIFLSLALLCVCAHRLPAPIQEVPEGPTPVPTVAPTAKPKPKPSPKPKPKSEASEPVANPVTQASSKQSRFAGTWAGIMPEVPWGDVPTELIVDQNENTMEWRETGKPKTATAARTTLTGDTLSARFPTGMTTAVWYISPQSDGVTANVRLTAFMNDQKAVFHRSVTQSSAAKSTPSISQTTTTTPAPSQAAGIPTAKPVPGKVGFVYNPFEPNSKLLFDVRSKPPGTKVKDPSGRLFIVP